MKTTKYYWSRYPGEFVNRNTGEIIVNPPTFPGDPAMWYHTLAAEIFGLSVPDQNIILIDLEVRTVLEHLSSYRSYHPKYDTLPIHENWPTEPKKFEFSGWISNGTNKKEVWIKPLINNAGPTEHKIDIFDLKGLDVVEINIKRMTLFDS